MSLRKFDALVPDAMSELTRMIEKGERESREARSVDRGTIRVKSNEKRARQLTLALKR